MPPPTPFPAIAGLIGLFVQGFWRRLAGRLFRGGSTRATDRLIEDFLRPILEEIARVAAEIQAGTYQPPESFPRPPAARKPEPPDKAPKTPGPMAAAPSSPSRPTPARPRRRRPPPAATPAKQTSAAPRGARPPQHQRRALPRSRPTAKSPHRVHDPPQTAQSKPTLMHDYFITIP
jgi:hypothetical protein